MALLTRRYGTAGLTVRGHPGGPGREAVQATSNCLPCMGRYSHDCPQNLPYPRATVLCTCTHSEMVMRSFWMEGGRSCEYLGGSTGAGPWSALVKPASQVLPGAS